MLTYWTDSTTLRRITTKLGQKVSVIPPTQCKSAHVRNGYGDIQWIGPRIAFSSATLSVLSPYWLFLIFKHEEIFRTKKILLQRWHHRTLVHCFVDEVEGDYKPILVLRTKILNWKDPLIYLSIFNVYLIIITKTDVLLDNVSASMTKTKCKLFMFNYLPTAIPYLWYFYRNTFFALNVSWKLCTLSRSSDEFPCFYFTLS